MPITSPPPVAVFHGVRAATAGGGGGPAVPFVTDTFTAADSTANPGRTPEVGGVIVHHATGSTGTGSIITSNRLNVATGPLTIVDYYPATPPSADYTVTATLIGLSDNSSASMGAGGRIDPAANTGVYIDYSTVTDLYRILQLVTGTATVLGSVGGGPPSAGGVVVDLVLSGNQATGKVAGAVAIGPVTTAVLAAGVVGIRTSGTNTSIVGIKLDNLSAT